MIGAVRTLVVTGSSPLTRGKRDPSADRTNRRGLIPAHAGKTDMRPPTGSYSGAHPRSRGENSKTIKLNIFELGSSPLTRGKLELDPLPAPHARLIPAHAGKTRVVVLGDKSVTAHPRSRGENDVVILQARHVNGSSPLTRGKHVLRDRTRGRPGLIPAHAGKTLPDLRFYCADRSDLGKP